MTISGNDRNKVVARDDDYQFFLQKGDPFLDGGATVGKYNEWRVCYGIRKLCASKSWFRGARLATSSEDGCGFDIVMNTVYGCIGVQIKSAQRQKNKFLNKHGAEHFIVIMVRRYYTAEEVCESILQAVTHETVSSCFPRNINF